MGASVCADAAYAAARTRMDSFCFSLNFTNVALSLLRDNLEERKEPNYCCGFYESELRDACKEICSAAASDSLLVDEDLPKKKESDGDSDVGIAPTPLHIDFGSLFEMPLNQKELSKPLWDRFYNSTVLRAQGIADESLRNLHLTLLNEGCQHGAGAFVNAVPSNPFARFSSPEFKDLLRYFLGLSGDIVSFAMHPDKRHIAMGETGSHPKIAVWDSDSLTAVSTISGFHTTSVVQLAFSADGHKLASVGGDADFRCAPHHHSHDLTHSHLLSSTFSRSNSFTFNISNPSHISSHSSISWPLSFSVGSVAIYNWRTRERLFTGKSGGRKVLDACFAESDVLVTCGVNHIQFWSKEGYRFSRRSGAFGKTGKVGSLSPIYSLCLFCPRVLSLSPRPHSHSTSASASLPLLLRSKR